MMKRIGFLLALALLVAPAAYAQELSYNYADVSYQWIYPNEDEVGNSNGLDSHLSLSPIEYFALEGGYKYSSFDIGDINTRVNGWTYGGLGYYPFCLNIHGLIRVGGISENIKLEGGESETENGVYAGTGVRYLFDNAAEVAGNITYSHVGTHTPAEWNYEVVGLYPIMGGLALRGAASIDDDSAVSLAGGLRYSF